MSHEPKTALTPIEKLKAAYFADVRGLHQNIIADLLGVNPGRVAEAVKDVRAAVGLTKKPKPEADVEDAEG